MKRRNFIKNAVVTSTGVIIIPSVLGNIPETNFLSKGNSVSELYQGFQSPPSDAKLFVRWWWNGNRLSKQEILRELDVMKDAGIGGVEINPIAFPREADPVGHKALTLFEDDWLDMLQTALEGAKERGLICDMIVGSGWPFGGEFLEKHEQTQMVTIETIDLQGGKNYEFHVQELLDKVDPEIHSKNESVYKELLEARLLPKEAQSFTKGTDFSYNLDKETFKVKVPEGEHVLYYIVKLTGYMAVINGAPGAAGPVLNHYNKEATEAYLNRISGFIQGKIGTMGNHIRAMFCDSMELEGANWNDDLPVEFEKRRGYDLRPYLPFVLKKVGHMGNPLEEEYGTKFPEKVQERIKRVRLDFYQTRLELFKERFIDTFNDWCHEHKMQSRMQAYGRGMHPLETSMEIDIPECETWLFSDLGSQYPDTGLGGRAPRMCNKYVASGAVLAGKKLVSCEEITNTSMAFMATLERVKIAGDQSNISGVNHSILHGFNYSPPEAGLPGWVRYGTYFSEQNTWWPHFKKWADYKARISYLLQQATPQANVAILQPLTDLWLKYGPQRDPFPQKWYPDYQNNLWEVINHNGGGCDYVSERIIKQATFKNGKMTYGNRSYEVLLLPEIETLDETTTRSLADFAAAGGKIVFVGRKPYKSHSYKEGETKDEIIKALVDDLLKKQNVSLYPAPAGNLINWYGALQQEIQVAPYIHFEKTHKFLSQSSYRIGDTQLFFIANTSLSEHISVKSNFNVPKDLYPWIWNPETGERSLHPRIGNENTLQLEIPRATSITIVFEKNGQGDLFEQLPGKESGKELSTSWRIQLDHVNGSKKQLRLNSLADLSENDEIKTFAGTIIYETIIEIASEKYLYLDLGDVQGVSELTLNGIFLGTKWYGAHTYKISKALKPGKNSLMIKVTTILGNYLKSLDDNRVAQAWTRHQDPYPIGMKGPVQLLQ